MINIEFCDFIQRWPPSLVLIKIVSHIPRIMFDSISYHYYKKKNQKIHDVLMMALVHYEICS